MHNLDLEESHNEYNNEPVAYCSECLSLRIRTVEGTDYCDLCGCTEIKEANIFDWEKEYEAKYGKKFIE